MRCCRRAPRAAACSGWRASSRCTRSPPRASPRRGSTRPTWPRRSASSCPRPTACGTSPGSRGAPSRTPSSGRTGPLPDPSRSSSPGRPARPGRSRRTPPRRPSCAAPPPSCARSPASVAPRRAPRSSPRDPTARPSSSSPPPARPPPPACLGAATPTAPPAPRRPAAASCQGVRVVRGRCSGPRRLMRPFHTGSPARSRVGKRRTSEPMAIWPSSRARAAPRQ